MAKADEVGRTQTRTYRTFEKKSQYTIVGPRGTRLKYQKPMKDFRNQATPHESNRIVPEFRGKE